jgi:hypothetical protein
MYGDCIMDDWEKGLERFVNKVKDKAEKNLREELDAIVTETKRTAPWKDESGRARREISGKVYWVGQVLVGKLISGAPYALSLEKGHGGKYRLIDPMFRRNRNLPLKIARW